jgi:hypothetical protein
MFRIGVRLAVESSKSSATGKSLNDQILLVSLSVLCICGNSAMSAYRAADWWFVGITGRLCDLFCYVCEEFSFTHLKSTICSASTSIRESIGNLYLKVRKALLVLLLVLLIIIIIMKYLLTVIFMLISV